MDHIPIWFPYLHLIIPMCTLCLLYFHRAILSHTFCRSSSSKVHMQLVTKSILMLSLVFSYSYLICTTLQTTFMFLPHSTLTFPSSICPVLSSYRIFSYVSGRCLLYGFFTSRTNDVFKNSYLRFTTPFKCLLSFYLILVLLTVVGGASYIYLKWLSWSIITNDPNDEMNGVTDGHQIGTFCMATNRRDNALEYLKYVLIWGSFHDVILSVLTVLSMASRLFSLIVESESRHKSHHSRFSIGSQLSFMSQRHHTDRDMNMNSRNSVLSNRGLPINQLKRNMPSDHDLDRDLFRPQSPTKSVTQFTHQDPSDNDHDDNDHDQMEKFPRSPSIIVTDLSVTASSAIRHNLRETPFAMNILNGSNGTMSISSAIRPNEREAPFTMAMLNGSNGTMSMPIPIPSLEVSRTASKASDDIHGQTSHSEECKDPDDDGIQIVYENEEIDSVDIVYENEEEEDPIDFHISTVTATATPVPSIPIRTPIESPMGSPVESEQKPIGSPTSPDTVDRDHRTLDSQAPELEEPKSSLPIQIEPNDPDPDEGPAPVMQRAMTSPITPFSRSSALSPLPDNAPTDFSFKGIVQRTQSEKVISSNTGRISTARRNTARMTLPVIQDLNEPAVRTSTGNVFSGHDALNFHEKTEDQNDTILLISKFCVILCCVIASSQTALLSYLVAPQCVMITYSVDTFVNTICLYLSFAFSRRYYDHYFCGKWCTRCCFPIIKTISLLCSSYKRRHGEGGTQKTCWIYCRCCCFGYCCDDQMDWEGAESIYALARFEVELMVMTDIVKHKEKSPTTPSSSTKKTKGSSTKNAKRSSTKRSSKKECSTKRRPVDQGG